MSLEWLEDRTLLNSNPVLSVPATTFNVVKTTTLSVTVSASDKSSGQILTFGLSGAPTGASITSTQVATGDGDNDDDDGSAAIGVLTWTPTEDQGPASFPFTITVTDSHNHTASQKITVTTDAVGLVGNNLLIVGTSINKGTATNPGNDVVSVNATTAPNVVKATVNGVTSGPFTVPTSGKIIANLFGGNDSFTLNEGTQPVGPNVVVDGGTGQNSLMVNGTSGADAFTITGTTVGLTGAGSIAYSNFQALAVNGLGGDDSFNMTGINPTTATTLDGGDGTNSFGGNFAQSFVGALTLANQQSATMQVNGDFTGSLIVNNPGALQQLSVTGAVTANSAITATNISNVTIGTLAGQLIASGGSLTGVTITSIAPSGLLQATETAGVPGSGVISNATIGVNAGTISAGSISGMALTSNSGSVITAGQGTTTNLSVGTNSGSITAMEEMTSGTAVSGTGTMSNTTIGANSGSVSAGSISGMSVTSNSGSITAAGQGTTTNLSVGTNTGSIASVADTTSGTAVSGTGVMSNTTIGTNSGSVSSGSISGMSVTSNSGSITANGQGTTNNLSVGTNSGSITAMEEMTSGTAVSGTGTMSNTTIGSNSGSVSSGSISGMSVTSNSGSITAAGAGSVTNLSVGTNSGTIDAVADNTNGSGELSDTSIGTLSTTGKVGAANADNLSIGTFAGSVQITNLLDDFSTGTVAASANLAAGQFGVLTAQHVAGAVNFVTPTVTRTLSVSPHNPGDAVPDYGYYYDGTGAGDPIVVVEVNVGSTPISYDLRVTTNTATNNGDGFDLAGLYSVDAKGNLGVATGIHNVVVGGNLLVGAVPAGAISFFNLPANTVGGVQLPHDTVAVAVAGNLPAASIVAKAVPSVAAGSFAGVSAQNATNANALVPLAPGTTLTRANDTFLLFVSEANPVAQFLVTGTGSSFDARKMIFADQVADNLPVAVADAVVSSGNSSTVRSVGFAGQGGSLTTAQPIATSIFATPGGSLGDLILSAPQGITTDITADRILGNIDAVNGGISGTIQTTGDLGRAFTDINGNITSVTYVHADGDLTGQILVGGNLVSQVNLAGELEDDGVIAVQGDIGAVQTSNGIVVTRPDGSLTRFGGINVLGELEGQLVAQGNVFGDINIFGGLSGRIGVKGNEEYGLSAGKNFSHTGILGNVSIVGGIQTSGAIVSAGLLGDDGSNNLNNDTAGTHLNISGNDKGILAALEDINFGVTGSLNQKGLFENVGSPTAPKYAGGANTAAIDAIFTDGGVLLDVTIPRELALILKDLLALHVNSNGNLTGTTP